MKTVCMIGEGAWGTAMATLLAANGSTVKLWCYQKEVADSIEQTRCNPMYLPDVELEARILPTTDMQHAVCDVSDVFVAIPVKYLRTVLGLAKKCYQKNQTWISLSKGIEQETLKFPLDIFDDIFEGGVHKAVVAGPSFAYDVAKKQITAVSIAAKEASVSQRVFELLKNDYFFPEVTQDIVGVQVGAALKNVIALGIGMLDGAGYLDNPKALLFTRGLRDLATLAVKLGGQKETLYGLSGVGDLVLTAMGSKSKNLEVGRLLGGGQSLEVILKETGYIPEGINTVQSLHQLCKKYDINLPVCKGMYQIIFEQKSLDTFMRDLIG